jgi:hypothetical protein
MAPADLPTTFGKYFLTEKLAIGGMAEIYLAKIVGPGGFEKPVVIKQIHPSLSGQRHFVDLFVAEAKTLVTLAHGNIVPVYELGVIDDTYFIAMEYIDGPTLYRFTEALARRGDRLPPAAAAWIAARILEGLDYAHRKGEGVIHRDLSPRNVMLSRDGEVKLVDFGIAVPLGAADDGDAQSAPTGSFPYMSPEQVRREPLSGQTDLFSVGVLFWEMLAGKRLFARPDPDATLAAVTGADIPPPSSVAPGVPARLDEIALRALQRDQAARWASAGEMLHELQRYLYSLDETPGPRDAAALVAKYCPPETRRLPTHADAPVAGEGDGGAAAGAIAGPYTARIERDAPPSGPRTTPIDRGAAAEEAPAPVLAGTQRRPRTETFATHVELRHMLERATPLFPIQAITEAEEASLIAGSAEKASPPPPAAADDDDDGDSRDGAGITTSRPAASLRMRSVRPDAEPIDDRPPLPPLPVPGRTPPSGGLLVMLALGTLALGAAAIVVFLRGRAAHLEPDARLADAPPADASSLDDAPPAPPADAAALLADAGAGAPADAPRTPAPPADAVFSASTHPDAPNPPAGDAATTPPPAGDATLVIGADPWGDIFVDGVRKGRTPTTLVVPAGKHAIDVVFGGDDPPRTKRYPVDLRPGETHRIDADFTKP